MENDTFTGLNSVVKLLKYFINNNFHMSAFKNKNCDTLYTKKTKLRGFSLQANYTDRATTAYWRIEGVTWLAQRIPTAVNLCFLDPEQLLFHSSCSSVTLTRLSGPHSRRTTSQKIW
jgi:hypothetical protein